MCRLMLVAALLAGCPKIKGADAGSDPSVEAAQAAWGSVAFTVDPTAAATDTFSAQGDPLTLTATDGEGYAWTLTVPADALTFPVTLTMTPFATLDAAGAAVPMTSGVMLEPNGLVLDKPATLTVTDPAGEAMRLFTGGHTGAMLRLGETAARGAAPTNILVHHFSVATGVARADQAALDALLPGKLGAALAAADALLADSNLRPPPPPPLSLHCVDPAQLAPTTGAYAQSFFKPEMDLADDLVALWFANEVPSGMEARVMRTLAQLGERMAHKLVLALDEAGDKPETFPALFATAHFLQAQWDPVDEAASLVPVALQYSTADVQKRIGAKVERAANQVLDKVIIEHDYTYIPELLLLATNAWDPVTGGAENTALAEKIHRALWFTVAVDYVADQTQLTPSDTNWTSALSGAVAWEYDYGAPTSVTAMNPLCRAAAMCGTRDVTVSRGALRVFSEDCSENLECGLSAPFTFPANFALRHVVCGPPMTIDFVQTPYSSIEHQAWGSLGGSCVDPTLCCLPSSILFGTAMVTLAVVTTSLSSSPPRLDGSAALTLQNKNAAAVDQTLSPPPTTEQTCAPATASNVTMHFVVTHMPNP